MIVPYAIAGLAGITTIAGGLMSYGLFAPRCRWFAPLIWHGPRSGPGRIALTFDDGPHPQTTPAILEVLNKHEAPATFFAIGAHVQRHPTVLRDAHAAGHLIANHSYDHHYTGLFGAYPYWRAQIDKANDVIESTIGYRPALFRPPMGFKHVPMARAARDCGCAIVTWSRRGWDGLPTTPARIIGHLNNRCVPGDIILLHDGTPTQSAQPPRATAQALDTLIRNIRSQGLALVRLDEMLSRPAYARPQRRPAAAGRA